MNTTTSVKLLVILFFSLIESTIGSGVMGDGGVLCAIGAGCLLGAPAIAAGTALTAHGATVAGYAAIGLGRSGGKFISRSDINSVSHSNLGRYSSKLPIDERGDVINLQKTADSKFRYYKNGERRTPKREIDYILQDGQLKFGRKHSFLSGGGNVDYAGRIRFTKDGAGIESWSNASGHYEPKADDLLGQQMVRDAFKKRFSTDLPDFAPVKF